MAGTEEDDDDLLFADEDSGPPSSEHRSAAAGNPWKILIVDDDPEVHAITRVVLNDVVFEKRRLCFLCAHSGEEARAILAEHDDLAAVLLDVVMETEDAGLRLVRHIREELGNRQVRIILRTGQPGQAPERQVIVSYDINDYKAKSELTAQKLFTTTVAALRSYQHIATIERGRRGLEAILDAAPALFEQRRLDRFAEGVLAHMGSLLATAGGSFLCVTQDAGDDEALESVVVTAGSGQFAGMAGQPVREVVAPAVFADVRTALRERRSLYGATHSVVAFRPRGHGAGVMVIATPDPLPEIDRRLAELFCGKIAVGFDNVRLRERLEAAQIATVHALGKLAEYKDEVTGDHVRRIGRWATAIARELRARGAFTDTLDDPFCEMIGLASMLHDVGKVGIPDAILRKAGKLDTEEMRVMREHAAIGGAILRDADGGVDGRSYLTLGAEIAESHHERFDGAGYPQGLAGDTIPLAGRIVAVADVYDALLHRRPYKAAWEHDSVIDLIRGEAGRHFDPLVVDAFLSVLTAEGLPAPRG